MKIWAEFKKFAIRGNFVDLAIGFTVGAAFTTVVKSAVEDLFMPPLGVLLGNVEFTQKFLVLQPGTKGETVVKTMAAAKEAGRYAMHGVRTELAGDELRMIATDGRRLSMASMPVEMKGAPDAAAIVPTKGMQLFCRVIADPLDSISFLVQEDKVGVATQNAEIFARLIDGDFPQYEAVVPAQCANRIEADADVLAQKLRLGSNVSGDETRAVRLKMQGEQLELFGRSAGRGEATAYLAASFAGPTGEIAFTPDYVLEGLKNGAPERVVLEFQERTSPGKFTLGENHVYVVMPITLDA